MENESEDIKEFFGSIAANYREKYSDKDIFLSYFFNERLEEAVKGIELKNKKILDIGAGTGNLYDHIYKIESEVDYYATDISSEMLHQSNIPKERCFVGEVGNSQLLETNFDLIFVLGVTTYLNDLQLEVLFNELEERLSVNGKAIVTFTNHESVDYLNRRVFKKMPRKVLSDKYVLTQDFKIYPRRINDIQSLVAQRFRIIDTRWLNHTVFPFNRIFKKFSVNLAQKFHRTFGKEKIRKWLSSDFMVVFQKNGRN